MIRAWIAVALLAGSWMFALGYFHPANPLIWAALVACATVLLSGFLKKLPSGRESAIALLLLAPGLFFVPWPLKIVPLLIALGLAVDILATQGKYLNGHCPHPNPLPQGEGTFFTRLARGAVAAGAIMAVQLLGLTFYIAQTARSHELPQPLPDLLAGIANLMSIDAAADGSKIVMHSMRQVHRLGATWELLLDPVTFSFFVGGLMLLALNVSQSAPTGKRWSAWIRALRIFTLIVIAWLPIRAGLLIAIYLYRVLRAEPDRALFVMNHFFTPWTLLVLLAVPLMLVLRFLRVKEVKTPVESAENVASIKNFGDDRSYRRHYVVPIVLVALAAVLFTAAVEFNPMGRRLGGRVKVVERHSTWEPTTRPYDTTWYGEPSGYNYAAIYDYLGQYYEMSRLLESDKIDDQTLAQCDVLIIKTPTARYSENEVEAVLRFVNNGGGVLLVGDHTNIYRMGTIINDITRPMGFIFRDDIIFSNEPSVYEQHFDLPWVAHPSLQYMVPMDFAGTCSIDPGFSHGRSTITNTGLWSMGPEYHHENYFPIAQYCPDMRYGAFIQAWAAWYGQGRALAFTDSTIFSNFATFQPGKAELMLGMIEWLNHGNPLFDPRPWLFLLGLASLCGSILIAMRGSVAWLVLLAGAICGWAFAAEGVAALHRWDMPLPEKINKPMTRVVIDRSASDVPLSKGAYTQGDGIGYGMSEQLIGRLGYYTIRQEGEGAFSGDALVVFCPNRPVEASYREQLERYVAEGGRLLVFDSPENVNSTANSLLWPFGLSVQRKQTWKGSLTMVDRWPGIDVLQAYEVSGGKPVARISERQVAAIAQHGKGTVMAVGFGSLLNDKNMGDAAMWMVEPDAPMLLRYEVLYSLVRLLVENKPVEPSATSGYMPAGESTSPDVDSKIKPRTPLRLPELPLQELGPQE